MTDKKNSIQKTLKRLFNRNLVAGGARLALACVLMIQLATAATVTVAWDANTESYLAGYNIYRSSQSGVFTSAALNGSALTQGTSFTDSTAQDSQTYYYVVKAVGADGMQSTSSNQIQVTTAASGPAVLAPAGLSVLCSADNKNFTVRWNAAAGAAGYYLGVDYKANNTNPAAVDGWYVAGSPDYDSAQVSTTSFTGTVTAGQAYEWWVGSNTTAPGTGPWTAGPNFTCGDATAPTVSISTPAAGASVSGASSISATAADNIGVVGVQFKVNGVNQGAEVTTAPYTTSWDTAALANKSYTVSAVARDLAGNQTTSAAVAVTVNNALAGPAGLSALCSADNKSFTLRWNAVAGAADYYLGVDNKTNNTNPAAVDGWYVAGSPDYSIDKTAALTFTGTVTAGQAYEWWVGTNTTAPGTGPWTAGPGFTCAAAAQTVAITSPAGGTTISGNAVTIAATAAGTGIASVQFKVNGVNTGTSDTTAPYSISWNTKAKANGVYSLTAVATDTAGKKTTSAPVSVTIQKGAASAVQVVDAKGDMQADVSAQTLAAGYARTGQADGAAILSLKTNDIVVSETSVPASVPVRQGRVYVDVSGAANTGLAIANDNDEAAQIAFYFTDSKGNDLAKGSFTVEAKSQKTAFVNQAPFNLAVSMQGSMTFDSSAPVSVAALRGFTNERGEFLMTTLPVTAVGVTPAGTSIVVPHFADGGGWTSQVVLTNPTDAPLAGAIQFFGAGSAETGAAALRMTVNQVTASSFSYTIAPRSSVRMATAGAGTDLQVGYVLATAAEHSAAPQGLLISSYSSEGITVSQAGVAAVSTGTAFRTYVESQGSLRSGLAIANPSASPAHAAFELTALDGTSTGLTASLEIPAGGHAARFINELFPAIPDGFQGTLRVVTTRPVAVAGLRTRSNERGDFLVTTMPVIDEAAPVSNGAKLLFPLVVNGGGYSTEFVGIQ